MRVMPDKTIRVVEYAPSYLAAFSIRDVQHDSRVDSQGRPSQTFLHAQSMNIERALHDLPLPEVAGFWMRRVVEVTLSSLESRLQRAHCYRPYL